MDICEQAKHLLSEAHTCKGQNISMAQFYRAVLIHMFTQGHTCFAVMHLCCIAVTGSCLAVLHSFCCLYMLACVTYHSALPCCCFYKATPHPLLLLHDFQLLPGTWWPKLLLTTPSDLDMQVLLSLGVSYTNELDQRRALSYLHTWLANHAKHGPQIASMQHPDDTSQRLSWVVSLFEQAAAAAPADADVQVQPMLGFLLN